jgi:HEAT repeat protein
MVDQFNRNNHKQEEIDRCLKLIQSRNPRDRSYAAKRLGEMKVRPDVLMSMMVDPNGFVRSASAEALGRSVELPAPEVISHLLAAIDDPNNYVCAAAVNSLGLLDAKQAVNQVEACLEDSHPIIVQAAILAMARIDPERIEDKLVDYLQSEDYLIHLAATRACGWLMHQACGELVLKALQNFIENNDQHDFKLPKLYIEVLTRLDTREAIPTLMEIAEREVGLRGVAVEALVEMKAEEAASILSPLLSDPSNRLRRNLIEMMMQADYEAAVPLVRPLLRDNAITVRETALAAVSKWKDRVSVGDVRQIAYSDPNPFVRPQAVITLTNLLGQEALPDLVELADDVNLHVRRAVAQSLAEIDHLSPAGKRVLLKLANDEDTIEYIKPALEKHDLRAVQPGISPEIAPKAPVPKGVRYEKDGLLDLLEAWQEALPNLQKNFALEELSDIDQALSTLILTLRRVDSSLK